MKSILSFILNGEEVEVLVEPTQTLLDVLRDQLSVLSAKRGCESGDCGACTVLLDGEPIRSCLTIALNIEGRRIETVESLSGVEGQLHPLQQSFHDHAAAQCGFCTSGQLLSAKSLLDNNPKPTRDEIVEGMSGNLCRCGAYYEIIEAIESVAGTKGKE